MVKPGFERVEVRDADGNFLIVDLLVVRKVAVRIDCGCYNHHAPRRFEILVTNGASYVRAASDGFFRVLDASGPITASIDDAFTS